MKYSNGFDLDAILPALTSRVGWRSENLVRSFESFHALCTEQNLRDVQPTENISDADFEDYRDSIKKDVIQRCLSSVFNEPEYIDQVLLHNRNPYQIRQVINSSDVFCGIRIRIIPDFGISTWIKTLTLFFDSNVTFNLYLYQDGNPQFLESVEVDAIANQPTVFDIEDLLLSYANYQSTVFYLGYYQNDLGSAKAIREQVCWSPSKAFGAYSFSMPRADVAKFNPAVFSYDTYGINAELHSFRDYTYKILRSPHLFDEAIGLSMVYYVLEQIISTTRSNSTERILKGSFEAIELKHYLYGSVPAMGVAKTTGLNEIINKKFLDIRESFCPKLKAQTVSLCS
jgi:hypothetical protein